MVEMFLGEVEETEIVNHKIMVPPTLKGKISWIYNGEYHVKDDDVICKIETSDGKVVELTMVQTLACSSSSSIC